VSIDARPDVPSGIRHGTVPDPEIEQPTDSPIQDPGPVTNVRGQYT
jgi:hypothetical protein